MNDFHKRKSYTRDCTVRANLVPAPLLGFTYVHIYTYIHTHITIFRVCTLLALLTRQLFYCWLARALINYTFLVINNAAILTPTGISKLFFCIENSIITISIAYPHSNLSTMG